MSSNYKISDATCLVVKIGSTLLVNEETGEIHHAWLKSFIEDVVSRYRQGRKIILVSSGAIALGKNRLKLSRHALTLEEKQAAASVGQIELAQVYQAMLQAHQITVAQLLLTLTDSESRPRYLNAKNTLETLLKLNVIPIINENDTVATAEIKFGDNDRLAARVAQMVGADTLVLLSDIEGLYTADPRGDKNANLVPLVKQLNNDILAMASNSKTAYGSGGMITKLAAAKIAMSSGCKMVIGSGKNFYPLTTIDANNQKTWFVPDISPVNAKKNWLANHLKPKGEILIDAGAIAALKKGKSLLAAGILMVNGQFKKGDAIIICNDKQKEIARGLTNYAAHEIDSIKGKKSQSFEEILGFRGSDEVVHRNDLVLLGEIIE